MSRPPVLLLHGFLGRGADWDAVRRSAAFGLGAARIIAPDLPGHGAAVGLPEAAYTMDAAARRVLGAFDGPADVVGYSMGGRLAVHLAVRHPERVRRLVVVSGSPGLRTARERAERRALDAERAAQVAADFSDFLDRWTRMPLFAHLPDTLRQRLGAERAAQDPAELGRSLVGMGTGAQPSHWGALGGISGPALAVAGALDPKFVGVARQMAQAGPVGVAVVPGAGHHLPAEAPDALAALLTRFLA